MMSERVIEGERMSWYAIIVRVGARTVAAGGLLSRGWQREAVAGKIKMWRPPCFEKYI